MVCLPELAPFAWTLDLDLDFELPVELDQSSGWQMQMTCVSTRGSVRVLCVTDPFFYIIQCLTSLLVICYWHGDFAGIFEVRTDRRFCP